MTSSSTAVELPVFPWKRECPFAPPGEYARLQEHQPVRRIELATGVAAWLVTRYEDVRLVLSDSRFCSDRAHPAFPYYFPVPQELRTNAGLLGMDGAEHAYHRRMLAREFNHRRVQQMRPRIQQAVEDCLDVMVAAGGPVDLVQALSLPVPTMVICELLGVPAEDQSWFHVRTRTIVGGSSSATQRMQALHEVEEYFRELIVAKERSPGDDLLSRVVQRYLAAGDYQRDKLVSIARLLLNAGHESSANMISLGTLTLLQHPEQLAMLRADPGLAGAATEELLRYLTVADLATARVAVSDVELGGQLIRAGEGVIALGAAANRDPRAFADADRLDLRRVGPRHLAFGHGRHLCIGADLTRLELEIVFGSLFQRLPALHLHGEVERLSYKDGALIYGVLEMPVSW